MNEIVIQIPIYKTAVLIYWGDRKGLYKAVKRNSDKVTAREVIEEVVPNTEGLTVKTSGHTVTYNSHRHHETQEAGLYSSTS